MPKTIKLPPDKIAIAGRKVVVDAHGRPVVDGKARPIKRKVEASTVAGIRRKELPCCLCDLEIMHGVIDGDERELAKIFRAQRHLGVFWVPVKDAAHLATCPDPPPQTLAFWHDRGERERYKAWRREQARKTRGQA